jgi:hypothetical protein
VRKQMLGLTALLAILLCCLVAGTPVNNDPSPAAEVAGIHLAAQPSLARVAAASTSPAPSRTTVAVLFAVTVHLVVIGVRRGRIVAPLDELVWAQSGARRGPPLAAS